MYLLLSKEATHNYINENHSELVLCTDYKNHKMNLYFAMGELLTALDFSCKM